MQMMEMPLCARAQKALNEWRARLSSLVWSAVRRGSLKRESQPYAVASLIIGTLEGALMMSRLDGDRVALKIARDHLISYILRVFALRSVEERWSAGSAANELRASNRESLSSFESKPEGCPLVDCAVCPDASVVSVDNTRDGCQPNP